MPPTYSLGEPPNSRSSTPNFYAMRSAVFRERSEGVRIRHSLNGNSLKMYDKEGSILRVETTIVRPKDFRVYRAKEGEPKGPKSWRILRKGVSDMYRRAQVCRAANQRYLEALASVSGSSSLLQEAAEVCAPIVRVLWLRKITLYSEPSAVASSPSVASATPTCALHSTPQPNSKQPRLKSAAAVPRSLAKLLCCELMAYSENCLAPIATKSLQKAAESSPPY